MIAANGWYIYTGRDGEVIPPDVTRVRIDKSVTVIPANAFYENQHIEELEFDDRVETVEKHAFARCPSLRLVIMRGVKVVEQFAFCYCKALTDVECGKLEIIGERAFKWCESLRSINLTSVKIVEIGAFAGCKALTKVEFGKELESIEDWAFYRCTSLERITIPLKDGIITDDDTFTGCENLEHVDLVEGEALRDTIDSLHLKEWRNDMNEGVDAINQNLLILSNRGAGGETRAIRRWISLVLFSIIHFKAQHRRLLDEAATTLQHAFPKDVVLNSILPFLKLPSYTLQGENNEGGG
eukprot:scaffold6045_cov77-Skeletonema_marinoi.AAC.1